MPRENRPFYRSDKQAWYARIRGKRVSLGITDRKQKQEALKQFYKLQVEQKQEKRKEVNPSVKEACKAFLADAEGRMSKGCFRNYELFSNIAGKAFKIRMNELTTSHIEGFIRRQNWSNSYKHNFIGFLITV